MRTIFHVTAAAGAAMLLAAAPAHADVVEASATHFELKTVVTVDRPMPATWEVMRSPQLWWSKDHTYSDDSANLSMDDKATGCFCEKVPAKDGTVATVEHGRIVYFAPGRMIRLASSLGPLQAEAVSGTLTLRLDPEGKDSTRLTMTYLVAGHIRGGAEAMAPKVDEVLALQMLNLKTAVEGASAAPPKPEPGR